MALLDLLGRRWALRIIWELREDALNFRDLRTACDEMSPSVLNTRLKELREADIITLSDNDGYHLTDAGRDLLQALTPLNAWAENWAADLSD